MRVWFAFGGVLKQALLRKAGGDGRQAARWWRRKKGAAEPLMPLIHQIFHLTSNAPVSERIHVSRPVLAPRLLCPRVYGYLWMHVFRPVLAPRLLCPRVYGYLWIHVSRPVLAPRLLPPQKPPQGVWILVDSCISPSFGEAASLAKADAGCVDTCGFTYVLVPRLLCPLSVNSMLPI
jgi:hypothetical protein